MQWYLVKFTKSKISLFRRGGGTTFGEIQNDFNDLKEIQKYIFSGWMDLFLGVKSTIESFLDTSTNGSKIPHLSRYTYILIALPYTYLSMFVISL